MKIPVAFTCTVVEIGFESATKKFADPIVNFKITQRSFCMRLENGLGAEVVKGLKSGKLEKNSCPLVVTTAG